MSMKNDEGHCIASPVIDDERMTKQKRKSRCACNRSNRDREQQPRQKDRGQIYMTYLHDDETLQRARVAYTCDGKE